MKILVLGGKGFVGSSVSAHLKKKHDVFALTRKDLNLLDSTSVKEFLTSNYFDVVINCAATMTNSDLLDDTKNNLGLFINFFDNKHLFGKFINMASGAEYDRQTDINQADEHLIFSRMPKDSYGWGQNIKSRICAQTRNFYNIRIFNCFGKKEISTRLFPRLLQSKGDFEITNDRYFDYFSIQDLCTLTEHGVENNWTISDVNAVYAKKYKISEVAEKFCRYHNLDVNLKIVSTSENNYTGSDQRLRALGVMFTGLEFGLRNY